MQVELGQCRHGDGRPEEYSYRHGRAEARVRRQRERQVDGVPQSDYRGLIIFEVRFLSRLGDKSC